MTNLHRLGLLTGLVALANVPRLDAQSLEERLRTVLPAEAEDRWLKIAWHTNLMTARQQAARQGKPLLLWVMNGNPLGCG
jgi:hypothetical protein